MYTAPYPHCHQLRLHAPGVCVICDRYPEQQRFRIMHEINFAEEHDPQRKPDPVAVWGTAYRLGGPAAAAKAMIEAYPDMPGVSELTPED